MGVGLIGNNGGDSMSSSVSASISSLIVAGGDCSACGFMMIMTG